MYSINRTTALLSAIMAISSFGVNASNDYSYISGGLQLSTLSEYIPTNSDNVNNYSTGYYVRGSWGFYKNFFAEARQDSTSKNSLSMTQSTYGLGYYYPFNNNISVYGLVGLDRTDIQFNLNELSQLANFNISDLSSFNTFYLGMKDDSLTAEIGAKINVLNAWLIEPAIRVANYDEKMFEVRLANTVNITKNIGLEANLAYRKLGASFLGEVQTINETNLQVGVRYAF